MDVFRNSWIGDYVDAMNFLALWTCDSGNNNTGWCNEEYTNLERLSIRETLEFNLLNQLDLTTVVVEAG